MTFKTIDVKENNNFSKLIPLFGLVILILIVLQIWVAHTISASGVKLSDVQYLTEIKKRENQILQNQIASASALLTIASQSASLGFRNAKNVQYIY